MASSTVSISHPSRPSPQPADAHLKKHHKIKGKGFLNPWDSWEDMNMFAIFRWALLGSITGERKPVDTTTPPLVQIRKPTFLPSRETKQLRATWLGHACYYVEFVGGLRVLFDPVFTQRCSPFSFMGPKRYTDMPCQIEDIPYIDVVVISHCHYDHLSYPTLVKIAEKHKDVQFFVPLGNKPWFDKAGFKNVTELDWWEEREVNITPAAAREGDAARDMTATISCLPCQHMSARTAFDKAHTLWASWSITSGGKSVWFGGDTGYRAVPKLPESEFDYGEKYAHLPHCPAFKEIGEHRGPFDLGLIPIGAYDPRWIMSPVHANPYDSVNIFVDTKCKEALGIHWGTWVLTDEKMLDPPKVLKEALKWKGLKEEVFTTCDIGVSREF
ncbi:putative metallo-beta-lactamase, N-acyl-phosphatidylethanolamine-hydrolyzing phospholipase D [Septoria linicola]|nr:putative metallo-beta-lactamase, N-acyl-phosphatidylethanolamine-hydrolyzing phospholipase D [Septoria linicola]